MEKPKTNEPLLGEELPAAEPAEPVTAISVGDFVEKLIARQTEYEARVNGLLSAQATRFDEQDALIERQQVELKASLATLRNVFDKQAGGTRFRFPPKPQEPVN